MKLLQLVIVKNHSNGMAFMTPTFDPLNLLRHLMIFGFLYSLPEKDYQ